MIKTANILFYYYRLYRLYICPFINWDLSIWAAFLVLIFFKLSDDI